MGGNVKDALTGEPTVTRDCEHCESEFRDEVKYGGHTYCPDCREEYDNPKYIEPSLDLDLDEDGTLLVNIEFDSNAPPRLNVRIPGEEVGEGIIFAEVTIVSDEGRCEDVISSDNRFNLANIKVMGDRVSTIRYPEKVSNTFRKNHREETGDLLEGDEITVTVEFYCPELDSCTSSLTVPKAVAKNI